MSGYTFIDDSQLSVCEKIKQYFEKNPTSAILDSSYSSSSSVGSIDLDASLQKVLIAKKLEFTIRNPLTVHANLCDETIDLCSPPGMSPAPKIPSDRPYKRKTVNLISFTDSSEDLEKQVDVIIREPKPHLIEDISFKNSISNDSWCHISDDTFERDEALCASILQDNNDETQLFDVEAPSSLWDQSIYPMEDSVSNWKSVACGRRLPSTILEESTINSETSRESAQYQPDAAITNDYSKCVLLKPTVLPLSSAPKAKAIPFLNSIHPESKVQPTNKSHYRPSMINAFPLPGKKKRNFYFTDSLDTSDAVLPSKSIEEPGQQLFEKSPAISKFSSHAKKKPLLTSPIQNIIRKTPAEPFELFTYPESNPASPVADENSATSSNQLSPAQPEFNDTLEVNINLVQL